MKANEAPEKIYVYIPDDDIVGTASAQKGFPHQFVTEEYIRKDAFIEKVCEYLMEYEFNDSPTIADRRKRVEDFRKYMEL